MNKVYVAGKFEEGARVREVHQRLRDAGFEITHDWTREDPAGRTGAELEEYLTQCAIKDYEGVLHADVVLVLNHDRLFGGATELGMALAWGKVAYIVEPQIRTNIFYSLPAEMGMRTFPDLDSAITELVRDTYDDHADVAEEAVRPEP